MTVRKWCSVLRGISRELSRINRVSKSKLTSMRDASCNFSRSSYIVCIVWCLNIKIRGILSLFYFFICSFWFCIRFKQLLKRLNHVTIVSVKSKYGVYTSFGLNTSICVQRRLHKAKDEDIQLSMSVDDVTANLALCPSSHHCGPAEQKGEWNHFTVSGAEPELTGIYAKALVRLFHRHEPFEGKSRTRSR